MQNFIPEEEIRRDQKIVDDGFYNEAYLRQTQPIVIKRKIGQKYGLDLKQCSKAETIAHAILLYLRTIRNQKTSFTADDIQDFYKLNNYLGSYDKLKPFLELESKSFIEFLLKHQYDYILSKCPRIKPYTLDNIDKITINRDLTNGSSGVKFWLERYKAIKKYFDETYGIKQNVAKETNKSKYDLEVLFSEETYEIREQLEEILENFINMCYDTFFVYQSPTHMKILQLSKKYRDLLHKKNPYYSSTHIPDEEEQRYIEYSNALYFVNVLYNHFNNIDKKEQRIEYSIKYFNKQFNDLINKKIIRTLLDKNVNINELNISELKKADFGYYFIINYGKGKLYANFLIQPESLNVSDIDEFVRNAYHLSPEHIHGEAVNYVMKVTTRPLNKTLNEGFDFNQINLALDDFDDEEQVQNIKSKQVQNRDYTKEYLDLMENAVNLDLPSKTWWCKYNLGCNIDLLNNNSISSTYEDWIGDHYAWGEIIPNNNVNIKSQDAWEIYKYCDGSQTLLTKYCSKRITWTWKYINGKGPDGKIILEDIDDPCKNKNSYLKFRMPSEEDVRELIENTYHKYVINYKNIKGLCGELFISKVNPKNQLFIPCEYNEYKTFQSSNCWINSINKKVPYEANCLYFDDSVEPRIVSNQRALLMCVRPVIKL